MTRKSITRALSVLVLFTVCLLHSCKHPADGKEKSAVSRQAHPSNIAGGPGFGDAVKGDFNGDGKTEYMWLVKPEIDSDGMDCKGDCTSIIKFSDTCISSIKVTQCIGGTPVNEGDLNKNGTDEIGLSPDWFTSCWSVYYVWTYLNGKWEYAVKPFSTHCNQWEADVKPVEVDLKQEGHVIIRYSESTDSSIEVRTKSIAILK